MKRLLYAVSIVATLISSPAYSMKLINNDKEHAVTFALRLQKDGKNLSDQGMFELHPEETKIVSVDMYFVLKAIKEKNPDTIALVAAPITSKQIGEENIVHTCAEFSLKNIPIMEVAPRPTRKNPNPAPSPLSKLLQEIDQKTITYESDGKCAVK